MTMEPKTAALSVSQYTERAQQNLTTTHTTLRETLRALAVTRVTAEYDGYSDSGQFEPLAVYRGEEAIAKDLGDDLLEQVEGLFFDLLESRQGGWELEDGAFGQFTWDLTTDELHQVHYSRFTECETFEYDGFGDERTAGEA